MEKDKNFNSDIVEIVPGFEGRPEDLAEVDPGLDENDPDSALNEYYEDYDSDGEYPDNL